MLPDQLLIALANGRSGGMKAVALLVLLIAGCAALGPRLSFEEMYPNAQVSPSTS
jgi:hypothetical protein